MMTTSIMAKTDEELNKKQLDLLNEANEWIKSANDCWNKYGKSKYDEKTQKYKEYHLRLMQIDKKKQDIQLTNDEKYLDIYEKDMRKCEDELRDKMSEFGCQVPNGANHNIMTTTIMIMSIMLAMNFVR
ncbi:hypothetical protein DERP_005039 [Dermatophagoides pteronyssinus]|uniref:Uncharacterized protein n=1 Tax=Dermatophagoides pteronyssinus TaxID=6956 RepID=A0ABQ8JTB2_DERPT|nr:hypothetical protein DERP_005039 [Dermatophagoides pteronyssinus]